MISTADELIASTNQVGIFKLANDIDLGNNDFRISSNNYILDLNGKSLYSNGDWGRGTVEVNQNAEVSIMKANL